MNRFCLTLAIVASVAVCAAPGHAQQVRLAPDSVTLAAGRALHSHAIGAVTLTADRLILAEEVAAPIAKSTHWKRGGLIGWGLGTVILYAFLVSSADTASEHIFSAIAAPMGGLVLGGLPGALIGGQFPKDSTP
jgi:hypothetical protein